MVSSLSSATRCATSRSFSVAEPKLTREQLAADDVAILMDLPTFRRFLSTIRQTAGIETVAYGPDDRHLHFMEGRRSLWCDMLRMAETIEPAALLLILQAELTASKETKNGRRKYNRLDTDTGTDRPEPGSGGFEWLDYGTDAKSDA